MQNTSKYALRIVAVGLMAALVFAASNISINLFDVLGSPTRIHLGNILCLLAGLLFGGVLGGLSAGIGSCFFDLFNPLYIASAPFTFAFKFLMAFICGKIAYGADSNAQNVKRNFIAAIAGQFSYILLYLGKSFIESLLLGNALETTLVSIGTKGVVSSVNAVIAILIAVPLAAALRAGLKNTGFYKLIVPQAK